MGISCTLGTRSMQCFDAKVARFLLVIVFGASVALAQLPRVVRGATGNASAPESDDDGAVQRLNPFLDIVYYDGELGTTWDASIIMHQDTASALLPSLFSTSFETGEGDDDVALFAYLNGKDSLLLSSTEPFSSDSNLTVRFASELQPLLLRVGGGDTVDPAGNEFIPLEIDVMDFVDDDSVASVPLSLSGGAGANYTELLFYNDFDGEFDSVGDSNSSIIIMVTDMFVVDARLADALPPVSEIVDDGLVGDGDTATGGTDAGAAGGGENGGGGSMAWLTALIVIAVILAAVFFVLAWWYIKKARSRRNLGSLCLSRASAEFEDWTNAIKSVFNVGGGGGKDDPSARKDYGGAESGHPTADFENIHDLTNRRRHSTFRKNNKITVTSSVRDGEDGSGGTSEMSSQEFAPGFDSWRTNRISHTGWKSTKGTLVSNSDSNTSGTTKADSGSNSSRSKHAARSTLEYGGRGPPAASIVAGADRRSMAKSQLKTNEFVFDNTMMRGDDGGASIAPVERSSGEAGGGDDSHHIDGPSRELSTSSEAITGRRNDDDQVPAATHPQAASFSLSLLLPESFTNLFAKLPSSALLSNFISGRPKTYRDAATQSYERDVRKLSLGNNVISSVGTDRSHGGVAAAAAGVASTSEDGSRAGHHHFRVGSAVRYDEDELEEIELEEVTVETVREHASSARDRQVTCTEPLAETPPASPLPPFSPTVLQDDPNMNIDFDVEIELGERLGGGASGSVYRARYKGLTVAAKVLHSQDKLTNQEVKAFVMEVELLRRLRHENIIGFYGACIAKPKLCIVQELAFGSLYDFLHVKKLRPDPGTLLRVGIDIASAMDYCHSLATPVIHRDLKSQNILLDADGRAKVADFGIARAKQHTFLTTKHVNAGTIAYMAPELFSAGYVDEKSDIYSFAVILWESYTQRIPWSEKQIPVQIVMAVGIEKKRLPVPPTMPRGLKTILRDSWRHDPRLRPSFKDLLSKLQIMLKKQHPISERTDDGSSGTDNEMTSSSS